MSQETFFHDRKSITVQKTFSLDLKWVFALFIVEFPILIERYYIELLLKMLEITGEELSSIFKFSQFSDFL